MIARATLLSALALSVFAMAGAAPASAASYSCMEMERMNKAERRICTSRRLGALDERLDSWYRRAKERASYFDQVHWLRREQLAWLRERNSCGSRYWCLRRKYRQRIRELKRYVEHV